jgi:hypothetical protein
MTSTAQLVREPPEDLAQPMKASDCDKQPAPLMREVSDKA